MSAAPKLDTAGRLPPHDLDAERAVLSTLMVGRPLHVAGVLGMLEPEDMYSEAHGALFAVARSLVERDQPTDGVTMARALKDAGKGGLVPLPYLAEILDAVPSVSRWEDYARIVLAMSTARRAIAAAQVIAAEGYGDIEDRIAWASELPARLEAATRRSQFVQEQAHDLKSLLLTRWRELDAEAQPEQRPPLLFQHRALDRCMGRWREGSLTVVAARSHIGKSSWARQVAMRQAERGYGVLIWSGEQPAEECADAIMSQCARVPSGLASYSDEQVHKVTNFVRLASDRWAPVEIHDQPRIRIAQLKRLIRATRERMAASRSYAHPNGVELRVVVVDYFQLMSAEGLEVSKSATAEERLGAISKALKSDIAMGEKVSVIAAAQLNKSADERDGIPLPSDIRGSSALEQDADKIILLHNPEAKERQRADRGSDDGGLSPDTLETCFAIFGKARQGGQTGVVPLCFRPLFGRFEFEPPTLWEPRSLYGEDGTKGKRGRR